MKKLASLLLTLALCAGLAVPALAAGFSDVPPGHYAAEAIEDCIAKGVASGYADGTFRPDQPVTNAQFAVMMARAFFPEDLAEFEAQAEGKPWYWAACKAVTENRASVGFIFEGQWAKDINKEVNRCQMASLIYKILNATVGQRGRVAEAEDRKAAEAKIADFDSIKSYYQIEVSSICALGIMSGYPDGTFGGDKLVNRGQACAVIQRTAREIEERIVTVQFPAVVTDPASTSVAVGKTYYGYMGWSIVNNRYPNGTLNNGKPITEENVLAMLADAKTNWYPGMRFGTGGSGEQDNCYTPENGTSSARSAIEYECSKGWYSQFNATNGMGGFASMLSDYIFGPGSNYPFAIEDPLKVRPGDIIIQKRLQQNGPFVTNIAIAVSGVEYSAQGTPMVRICAGGYNDGVVWDDAGQPPHTRLDNYMGGADNSMQYVTLVFSRYPK